MSETTTDQQQTTIRTPGPYPEGGEAIWQQFLNQYFGTPHMSQEDWDAAETKPYGTATYDDYLQTPEYPGLLQGLQDQNQFEKEQWDSFYNDTLNPAYNQFTGQLDYAMGAGDRYQDMMGKANQMVTNSQIDAAQNPFNLTIGGQNFHMLNKGGINMSQDRWDMARNLQDKSLMFDSSILPSLAAQKLTGQLTPAQANYNFNISHNPAGIQNDYLQGNLGPLALNMQNLRYGIPTQSMTGQATGSQSLGTMGTIGQGLGLLGDLGISGTDVWGAIKGLGEGAWDGYNWLSDGATGLYDYLFSGDGAAGDGGISYV